MIDRMRGATPPNAGNVTTSPQGEVASRLDRHEPLISNIESGERRIDVIELLDLAGVVGFDLHRLIDDLAQAPTG